MVPDCSFEVPNGSFKVLDGSFEVPGEGRGLAVARWTQSRRSRVRYCSGASFIKISPH